MTESNAAKLDVLIHGKALAPEVLENVVEARVELGISMPDRLTIGIADPELKIIDGATIDVGDAIEVKLGAPGAASPPTSVFKGEVISVEGDIGPSGAHVAIVSLDKSHRLRRNSETRAFRNVTVGDVARQIASKHGLKVGTIEAQGPPYTDIVQHSESDWTLLERLCDEADCDIDVNDDSLNVFSRRANGRPAITLSIGDTLRAFRPRLSGAAQVDTVHVRGWDPTQKQAIVQQAKPRAPVGSQTYLRDKVANSLGGGDIVIVDHPVESSGIGTVVAQSAADRLGSTVIEATGVAVGTPSLTPGALIKLSGVGKRFGGEHRVVGVTHLYRGARGYETQFTLGAGGRSLVEELGGRRQRHSFASHLAIGLVTQNKDPDEWGRVKVKYPALDDATESVWARIAWPAAGSSRGIVAIPEIGDEVAIGFEHGDIERPVVLGVLFNGHDTPGDVLTAKGSSVAVQMPRSLTTQVDESVTTTAGQAVTITAKQGAVAVSSQQAGMKLSAQQALEISSSMGSTKLSAMAGTTIEDEATITLNANGSVSIRSNGSISIEGTSVQLTASGMLQLAGAQVMLG